MTGPIESLVSREHVVDVGAGVQLHVIERCSAACGSRGPRRAILMIPATLTTNVLYDAQIGGDPSFNVLDRTAREGYAAFSVSYEGYGKSSRPADGGQVTYQRSLEQMGKIVEWIRAITDTAQVDVLGTSVGSDLAIGLGAVDSPIDPDHVGRIVLTATVYRAFSERVSREAFTPAFEAHLRGLPGGIVQTEAAFYDLVLSEVAEPARAWAAATFPDRYATGPTLAAFALPVVQAPLARAPALLFWGTRDPVTALTDVDDLVAEYGGPIRLVKLDGGGHSPFLEPQRDLFWSETLRFLGERA